MDMPEVVHPALYPRTICFPQQQDHAFLADEEVPPAS